MCLSSIISPAGNPSTWLERDQENDGDASNNRRPTSRNSACYIHSNSTTSRERCIGIDERKHGWKPFSQSQSCSTLNSHESLSS